MSKTVEELLRPRYKVVADWPNRFFFIGSILHLHDPLPDGRIRMLVKHTAEGQNEPFLWKVENHHPNDYPHLFKKLEWWEERAAEDIPKYIRFGEWDNAHAIYKIIELFINDPRYGTYAIAEQPKEYFLPFGGKSCYPATEEEYNNYKSKKDGTVNG